MRLVFASGTARAIDDRDVEQGRIAYKGILPGVRFAMQRNGAPVWTLTVRSFVRKRHQLRMFDGANWVFDTPFFWWQHLTGRLDGQPALIGKVGPTKRSWGFMVDPRRDSHDLLAAVGFMHWKWQRW